jgi:hypothetical protein
VSYPCFHIVLVPHPATFRTALEVGDDAFKRIATLCINLHAECLHSTMNRCGKGLAVMRMQVGLRGSTCDMRRYQIETTLNEPGPWLTRTSTRICGKGVLGRQEFKLEADISRALVGLVTTMPLGAALRKATAGGTMTVT